MAWNDLRDFLTARADHDDVLVFEEPVDPELEIGAIWTQLARDRGPVALHEKGTVEGYPEWRVATNLFGTFPRLASVFEVDEDDLFPFVSNAMNEQVKPKEVRDGPVNEVEYMGDEVDITQQVPNIKWNDKEGGAFITAGHNVIEDPEYGTNTGWYRIQIMGPRRITVRLAPYHHGGIFAERARDRGLEELDVAIYVGGDPIAICGSAARAPIATDEYDLMGAFRGEPLELIQCKTVDRRVPAAAELVIEGKIQLTETVEEGPFGEFLGFYSDTYQEHPVEITRIAHRSDPIFVGSAESKPVNETHLLQSLYESAFTYNNLVDLIPEVTDVFFPPSSMGFFECIIQVNKQAKIPGYVKNVLYSTVAGNVSAKHFILVDDDIDIRDRDEIQWVLASRVQADRDVHVLTDGITTQLDPSATHDGVTDKMLIDATRSEDFRGDPIEILPDIKQRAEQAVKQARTGPLSL